MVPLLTRRQELSAPDDGGENSDWGPMQIATPIIIGVGLIIVFAAFILWQRRSPNKLAYHYHQARNAWVARAERIFLPRRVRHRVLHSSDPVTLDDSILTPNFTLDFRRVRQHRSDSSDSQTALTTSTYSFDYPPKPPFSKSPSPSPERRPWRWWRFLKSKPEEITSEEPGLRWRIDGPDGSSTGHGHSILDPEERNRSRYISGLEVVNEELETAEDSVIRIGNNFSSIESTPLTQYFHEERFRLVPPSPAASTAPVYPVGPRTPGPTPTIPQTPPPPGYSASPKTHTRQLSTEDILHPAHTAPYMLFPAPVRGAGYRTPHMFHGRQLSSESFLTAQSPMTPPSMY